MQDARTKPKMKLHIAMRDHGISNFEFLILEDNIPFSILDSRECYYIELFDTTNDLKGYNVSFGGVKYRTHPPEVRKRMSEIMKSKKRKLTPEQRKKLSDGCKTPEHREKCRQRMLGKPSACKGKKRTYKSVEHKERSLAGIRKSNFGRYYSPETREKLRNSLSKEERHEKALRAVATKKLNGTDKMSPEARKKISISLMGNTRSKGKFHTLSPEVQAAANKARSQKMSRPKTEAEKQRMREGWAAKRQAHLLSCTQTMNNNTKTPFQNINLN